jgi:hypothetical protein
MIENMEILMNLGAGLTGAVFALVGLYSLAAIWSDELP